MADAVRVFDMFCGAGGSSRGAHMAGAKPVAAFDMWELAAETFKQNFPDATVYRMKAQSLSPHRVLGDAGKIDLILASPECTNHSVAKGNAPRCEVSRATAFEVVRFAKVLRPRWIVVENVMQMRTWDRFGDWLNGLEKLGYNVAVDVLNAQNHGAPQSRRRLIVVCDLEQPPSFPPLVTRMKRSAASILGQGEPGDRPWQFRPLFGAGRAPATIARAKRAMKVLGRNRPFLMVYYGSDGAGGFQTLERPLRTVTTLDRFALVKPNGTGHEMRMLQPPELAAAMGFPPTHKWPGTTRRDRIKLIGNAVCPAMMRDVVRELIGLRRP